MDSVKLWRAMKSDGAVWEYPKDSRAPHVRLRKGRHSDGFVNTLQYLSDVSNLNFVAEMLAEKLEHRLGLKIDWVIGSPMAGISLATMVASYMGATRIGFNEKIVGGDKDFVCRFDIPSGQNLLMIEEMTTTGATPQRGIDVVMKKNPGAIPLDVVGAFLIRCGDHPPALHGRELISLVSLRELDVHYNEWEEGKCPLCDAGSRPIKNCKQVWKNLLRTMQEPTFTFPIE